MDYEFFIFLKVKLQCGESLEKHVGQSLSIYLRIGNETYGKHIGADWVRCGAGKVLRASHLLPFLTRICILEREQQATCMVEHNNMLPNKLQVEPKTKAEAMSSLQRVGE